MSYESQNQMGRKSPSVCVCVCVCVCVYARALVRTFTSASLLMFSVYSQIKTDFWFNAALVHNSQPENIDCISFSQFWYYFFPFQVMRGEMRDTDIAGFLLFSV